MESIGNNLLSFHIQTHSEGVKNWYKVQDVPITSVGEPRRNNEFDQVDSCFENQQILTCLLTLGSAINVK